MKRELFGFAKRAWSFILAVGAFLGVILAGVQIYDWMIRLSAEEYSEGGIPLVYMEVRQFKEFLDDSAGKVVFFNTRIVFDDVVGVNHLAHHVCRYDDFLESVRADVGAVDSIEIGLMKFEDAFVQPSGNYYYNSEEQEYVFARETIENVSCYDKMRVKVKDPSSLRLSFGGTGTISLPLYGKFLIEKRYHGGPGVEYTLREM